MTDGEPQVPDTDWFSVAQAAAQAAQDIAVESAQHRIELNRLRALNQGKDNQIEAFQNSFNTQADLIRSGRNNMKVLLDAVEFFQDAFETTDPELRDTLRNILGTGLVQMFMNVDVEGWRKECGCGEPDSG